MSSRDTENVIPMNPYLALNMESAETIRKSWADQMEEQDISGSAKETKKQGTCMLCGSDKMIRFKEPEKGCFVPICRDCSLRGKARAIASNTESAPKSFALRCQLCTCRNGMRMLQDDTGCYLPVCDTCCRGFDKPKENKNQASPDGFTTVKKNKKSIVHKNI